MKLDKRAELRPEVGVVHVLGEAVNERGYVVAVKVLAPHFPVGESAMVDALAAEFD